MVAISRIVCVACKTLQHCDLQKSATTKKCEYQTDGQMERQMDEQTDAEQSDSYVPL